MSVQVSAPALRFQQCAPLLMPACVGKPGRRYVEDLYGSHFGMAMPRSTCHSHLRQGFPLYPAVSKFAAPSQRSMPT